MCQRSFKLIRYFSTKAAVSIVVKAFNKRFRIINILTGPFMCLIGKTKAKAMGYASAQQEIILVSGSRFATRQYIERDVADNSGQKSAEDRFKDACWNGLLREILPEIFIMSGNHPGLYLWQMREAQHILALEMAEFPTEIDLHQSIDPYYFLDVQGYS